MKRDGMSLCDGVKYEANTTVKHNANWHYDVVVVGGSGYAVTQQRRSFSLTRIALDEYSNYINSNILYIDTHTAHTVPKRLSSVVQINQ